MDSRAKTVALKTIAYTIEIKKLNLNREEEAKLILLAFLHNYETTPPPFQKGGIAKTPTTKL